MRRPRLIAVAASAFHNAVAFPWRYVVSLICCRQTPTVLEATSGIDAPSGGLRWSISPTGLRGGVAEILPLYE
jgi:hypothetical protein